MQTSTPTPAARPAGQHLSISFQPVWPHEGRTDLSAWVQRLHSDPELQHLNGMAAVLLTTGSCQVSLNLTAADLRALAHLSTVLADEMDCLHAAQRVLEAA